MDDGKRDHGHQCAFDFGSHPARQLERVLQPITPIENVVKGRLNHRSVGDGIRIGKSDLNRCGTERVRRDNQLEGDPGVGEMRRQVGQQRFFSQPGEPLLAPVMHGGRRIEPRPTLADARRRAAVQLEALPSSLRSLDRSAVYRVDVSEALAELAREVDRKFQ